MRRRVREKLLFTIFRESCKCDTLARRWLNAGCNHCLHRRAVLVESTICHWHHPWFIFPYITFWVNSRQARACQSVHWRQLVRQTRWKKRDRETEREVMLFHHCVNARKTERLFWRRHNNSTNREREKTLADYKAARRLLLCDILCYTVCKYWQKRLFFTWNVKDVGISNQRQAFQYM